ncbi:MAG TPA: hypothetical protein VD840_15895, partial [Sinorhizobium sp.]|nr:hypothetical protein [Sinorhizobium sp.]
GQGSGNDLLGKRVDLHLQFSELRIVFPCGSNAFAEPLEFAFRLGELPFRLLQYRRRGSRLIFRLIRGSIRLRLLGGWNRLVGFALLDRRYGFLGARRSATGKGEHAKGDGNQKSGQLSNGTQFDILQIPR